jgi:hypothetical protein
VLLALVEFFDLFEFVDLFRCVMMTSIEHPPAKHLRSGFLLLEVLVGIAIFSVFLTGVGLTLLYGQESSVMGGDRVRAGHAALRALEAARSVRDGSFSSLSAGTHGVAVGSNGKWRFSGSVVTVSGGYVTNVTVTSLASDWVRLAASTKWKHGYARSGSVLLTTELTDWRSARSTGDWSTLTLQGSYVDGATPLFNDIAVRGNYAFVTSDTSSGGAGLYVFDISSLSAPARVANSFSLGTAGYGLAIKGNTLFVVTGDATQEIRAYDIASPATLAAGNLRGSYNLSGSSLATSLAVEGPTLYVGATQHATYDEFYALEASSTGSIIYRDSLAHSATVNAVSIAGTGAYLATAEGTAEMKAVNVTNPADLRYITNSDFNITSTEAGRSIATSGTAALLGRQKGSIQELAMFDIRNGGGSPPPSPGPWYYEGSGSLVGLDVDGSNCYAFLAADSSTKAVQVVHVKSTATPPLSSYTSTSGQARGLHYDPSRDRLFVITRRAFLIFQPSSSASSCS